MADTIAKYNTTLKRFLNKEVSFTDLKAMLLSDDATFDATNTTLDQVAGAASGSPPHRTNELYGNGWTEGGEALSTVTVSTVSTSSAKLAADNISKVASGGPLPSAGSAYKMVIYDDADDDKAPLYFVTFDSPRQAGEGTNFLVAWNANGITQVQWV